MYKTQTTLIDINGTIKQATIRKRVMQRCPLSSYLFNLFNIFNEASMNELKSKTGGIKINGQRIHCIRFADDIVLLAEPQNDMNKMLNNLPDIFNKYHMKINGQKIKTMLDQ